MTKTVSANLKTELQSGAPVIATCWKIERVDGTVLGFTDWPEPFDYLSVTYNSTGGYQRTAIDQREGLSVDNMDVIGIIDSDFISETDLLSGAYRGAKVWIFAVSPGNLGWGDLKLDYGLLGEIHVGEIHFVAEFRSLITKLSQEFGSKFSRYCRHKLGSSSLSNGVEQKCGIVLKPSDWASNTAYTAGVAIMPQIKNGLRYVAQNSGTSGADASFFYDLAVDDYGPLAYWRLGDYADPNWSNVKLLLHCNGTDQSTTITDSGPSTKTVTATGNARLDTSIKYFGTAALELDGIGDYAHVPDSTDWDWSASTFTAECWAYCDTYPSSGGWEAIFAWHTGSTGWRLVVGDSGQVRLRTDAGASDGFAGSAGNLPLQTWTHIAMVIDGSGNSLLFINGVLKETDTSTSMTAPVGQTFKIGSDDGTGAYFDGWLDEIRITKGTARYSADFIVERKEFPNTGTDPTTAEDETGNYDGTYNNTPTLGVAGLLPDHPAKAVDFDSTATENVSADYAGLDDLFHSGGSVAAIVEPDSGFATSMRIVAKDAGTAVATDSYGGWAIGWKPTSEKFSFFQRFGDGVSSASNAAWETNSTFSANSTYHVVLTYNAGATSNDPEIWINGAKQAITETLSATGGHTARTDADAVLYIGNQDTSQGHGSVPFDGEIQEVTLFDRILTDTEIAYLWAIANTGPADDPPWNETIGGTTTDGGITWKGYDAYTKLGTVTGVTSDYVFADTDFTDANGNYQYGVITWLTGDNAGRSMDVKSSTNAGSFTLRQAAPFTIQVGDTFEVHVGCNHILKMPSDTLGSAYTGDCRAKFSPETTGNAKNFGGEPELPNIDRVSAPAGNV